MTIKTRPKEACLSCHKLHEIPEYVIREEDGKTISAPADIECCGTLWRAVVPFFKTTPSGYQLRQLHPNEVPRK